MAHEVRVVYNAMHQQITLDRLLHWKNTNACRAMTFVVTLLENLIDDHLHGQEEDKSFSEIVTVTYSNTLQQYHGWLTSGTFTLLLKLVPYKDSFWNSLPVDRDNPKELQSMQDFCEAFRGVLNDIYRFLDNNNLNNPAKV